MFALTNTGGMYTATVPDVCNTPSPTGVIPMTYPNIAQGTLADPGSVSQKVMISGGLALTLSSRTLLSSGDEAGVSGGVASGKFIGEAAFSNGSAKVRIEGKAAVRLSDPTTHNARNTMGLAAASSQSKVMIS